MPQFCGVVGCCSTSLRNVTKSFFRLPSIKDNRGRITENRIKRRQAWIQALHREDLTDLKLKYMRICSDHFITGKPSSFQDVDHRDFVPNQRLGHGTRKRSRGCSSKKETPPLVFVNTEVDEVAQSYRLDHDYTLPEVNPLQDIKSEMEIEESEIKCDTEFGNPVSESYQHLLKENENLRKELERLNLLVKEQRQELVTCQQELVTCQQELVTCQQELVTCKENEMRLEQIVQSVKAIVNEDIGTIRIKQEV